MYNRVNKIFFHLSIFILIMALSFVYNSLDVDLWSRLIMGQHVALFKTPMVKDVISYSPTYFWYDHEWFSSTIIYYVQKYFGIWGLTFLKGLGYYLVILFLTFAIKEVNEKEIPTNYFLYIVLISFLVMTSLIEGTIRCQLITFFILPLWIYLLERVKNSKDRALLYMPFLMLFWLNSHGGAMFGLGILFLYVVGEFLNKNYKLSLKLLIEFFICALMFLINPWGIYFIVFLIKTIFTVRIFIGEWASPFGDANMDLFIYKFIAFLIPFIFAREFFIKKYNKINKTKWLIIFSTLIMSVFHFKHVMLFLIVSIIFLYEDFYNFYNNIKDKFFSKLKNKDYIFIKNSIIFIIIICYSIFITVTSNLKQNFILKLKNGYPINSVNFLKENNIQGKILAPYYVSSFIGYKYYPKGKIFMDGRQEELYPSEYIFLSSNFFRFQGFNPLAILERFPADIIILENKWDVLKEDNLEKCGFVFVFGDNRWRVYLKKDKAKASFKAPKSIDYDYLKNIFENQIFE